jgi:hypothetical protein
MTSSANTRRIVDEISRLTPATAACVAHIRSLIDPHAAGPSLEEPWHTVVLRAAERAGCQLNQSAWWREIPLEQVHRLEAELVRARDEVLVLADECGE